MHATVLTWLPSKRGAPRRNCVERQAVAPLQLYSTSALRTGMRPKHGQPMRFLMKSSGPLVVRAAGPPSASCGRVLPSARSPRCSEACCWRRGSAVRSGTKPKRSHDVDERAGVGELGLHEEVLGALCVVEVGLARHALHLLDLPRLGRSLDVLEVDLGVLAARGR